MHKTRLATGAQRGIRNLPTPGRHLFVSTPSPRASPRLAQPADSTCMNRFWRWWVALPALVVVAVSIAAGYAGVVDWPLALSAAAVAALCAKAAATLAGRAAKRAHRQSVVIELAEARKRLGRTGSRDGMKRNRAA